MTAEPQWVADVESFLDRPVAVPDEVCVHATETIADVVSATVAGTSIDTVDRLGRGMQFSQGPATIVGTSRQVSPEQAALVNATASVAQEIEEGHNEGGHVGACVVSGGLAMAEREGLDGDAFVEACIRAYEVCIRVEWGLRDMKDAVNASVPWLVRNPHTNWTTVGPALSAGLCAGLGTEELMDAFRTAANTGIVSMHDPFEEGSMTRNVMAGFSAQTGVSTALAAEAGLTGARSAMTSVYDPARERQEGAFERRFSELGEAWEITRNYFKFSPSCRHTHPPLDALMTIRDQVRPEDVEAIEVYAYDKVADLDYRDPAPFTSAKFSVPYVLASYLVRGDPLIDHFDEASVADERVRALAGRIDVHADEAYQSEFPEKWQARVEVAHSDGSRVVGTCEHPRGDYRNRTGAENRRAKFERLLGSRFDEDRTTRIVDVLLDLSNHPISELTSLLRVDD